MTQNQRSTLIYSIPFVILSIPLITMQFTKEVNWTLSDFLIMGILLFITTFTIDFVLKKFKIKVDSSCCDSCFISFGLGRIGSWDFWKSVCWELKRIINKKANVSVSFFVVFQIIPTNSFYRLGLPPLLLLLLISMAGMGQPSPHIHL